MKYSLSFFPSHLTNNKMKATNEISKEVQEFVNIDFSDEYKEIDNDDPLTVLENKNKLEKLMTLAVNFKTDDEMEITEKKTLENLTFCSEERRMLYLEYVTKSQADYIIGLIDLEILKKKVQKRLITRYKKLLPLNKIEKNLKK